MSDKAEKLAAAKKKFKEFQNRKQKKDAGPEQSNAERSISHSPSSSSIVSNSNGIDSNFGTHSLRLNQDSTLPSSGAHSRTSSVSFVDYQNDILHGSQSTNNAQFPASGYGNSAPFYDRCAQAETAGEEPKPNGSFMFLADTPEAKNSVYPSPVPSEHSSQGSTHGNRTLLRQFSQIEAESVRSSPELNSSQLNSHLSQPHPSQFSDQQLLNSSPLNQSQFHELQRLSPSQSNESQLLAGQVSELQRLSPSQLNSAQLSELQRLNPAQLNSAQLESRLRQKKNLMDFQSSKSSSAESEKTNANSTSSDSATFPRRTDSLSTLYSSSDNADRKFGVGDSFEHADVLELERRVEELAGMLHAERARNGDSRMALSRAENRVRELEKEVEGYRSIQNEVTKGAASHDNQIKTYVQTIQILVSEKTELERLLDQRQHELNATNAQLEEHRNKTVGVQHRISELEAELARSQEVIQRLENALREAESKRHDEVVTQEELRNDLVEARAKLESKSNELQRTEERLRETESQLSLATLRVQQLSNNDGAENCDNELKVLQEVNTTLATKVATLEQSLRVLELERDNAASHYQSYVRSLNAELSSLRSRFEGLNNEKDHLVVREESLVQHVAELEKQLQTHQVKIDELSARSTTQSPRETRDDRVAERVEALELEKRNLEEKLCVLLEENEKLVAQNSLNESKVEQLEAEQIDMSSLQVTLESDRVAASRAIQQNNELKQRLQELQDAFIKLSNEKLDLTERLQHEESVNKDYAEKLQQEQSRSKDYAEKLEYEQSRSKEYAHHLSQVSHSSPKSHEIDTNRSEGVVEEAYQAVETEAVSRVDAVCQTSAETTSHMDVEAMTKLEDKFRKKMKELADLSDEKQRLEHLVTQLQSETETIGEYVALYQTQRGALQEKAKEKDQQVVKLAQDKENLRNKLAELTELIKNLIAQQGVPAAVNPSNSTGEPSPVNGEQVDADQIMSLLSDIGSTSLSQPASNFHPCPWCSGQLITV